MTFTGEQPISRPVSGAAVQGGPASARTGADERGSALIIAILIVVIMSLMGLAFALVAETENKISVNQRHQGQALYVAEGAVRTVKSWFDDPEVATGFLVPTAAQVDRTHRWVDDDNDGTLEPYAGATPPWNVIYKQADDDLFDKPYRGKPVDSFEGSQTQPDLRISASGSAGEIAYLQT